MSKVASTERSDNRRVPSVDRAVRVLQLFGSGEEALGVSELARRLEVNKSTLHGILNTLCFYNLLDRNEATKTYRLGYGLFALGSLVQGRIDLSALAHPYVAALAREQEETVLLGVLREEHIYILDREEAPHALRISAQVGYRLPFSSGVFGQIFGAALSPTDLEGIVKRHGLRAFTSRSLTRMPAFLQKLSQVRERGYAIEKEEFLEGVSAVAASIANSRGQVVAALCVVGLSGRMPDSRLQKLGLRVKQVGQEISRRLGAPAYPCWSSVA